MILIGTIKSVKLISSKTDFSLFFKSVPTFEQLSITSRTYFIKLLIAKFKLLPNVSNELPISWSFFLILLKYLSHHFMSWSFK